MAEKKRLDTAIFELGLAESREKAKAFIMAGEVFINGERENKPGTPVKVSDNIEFRGKRMPYVSRGGLKLEKAMASFGLKLDGLICMDVGASTGGFTDCMLQNGAARVYSVDVGYGQLAWKLRSDERVVCLERTNARYLTNEQVPDKISFSSIDVSFISLELILPVVLNLSENDGMAVCLIKPQFEAGKGNVGKNGVVKDPLIHEAVIKKIIDFSLNNGFSVSGLDYSPVKGPQGNIEYLLFLEKSSSPDYLTDVTAKEIVSKSHHELDD